MFKVSRSLSLESYSNQLVAASYVPELCVTSDGGCNPDTPWFSFDDLNLLRVK